jgi:solute:Na+ symporter, SSS family
VGWAVGTIAGTAMAVASHFASTFPLALGSHTFPGYAALYTVVLNLVVSIVLTPIFNAMSARPGAVDATLPADYFA